MRGKWLETSFRIKKIAVFFLILQNGHFHVHTHGVANYSQHLAFAAEFGKFDKFLVRQKFLAIRYRIPLTLSTIPTLHTVLLKANLTKLIGGGTGEAKEIKPPIFQTYPAILINNT